MTTYISLPSNDPSVLAGSTIGNYTVQLGRSLDFSGAAYEVFLLEARFRMTWRNVKAGENQLVQSGNAPDVVPPGYYESVPQLCTALDTLFVSKGVSFTPLPLDAASPHDSSGGKTATGPYAPSAWIRFDIRGRSRGQLYQLENRRRYDRQIQSLRVSLHCRQFVTRGVLCYFVEGDAAEQRETRRRDCVSSTAAGGDPPIKHADCEKHRN